MSNLFLGVILFSSPDRTPQDPDRLYSQIVCREMESAERFRDEADKQWRDVLARFPTGTTLDSLAWQDIDTTAVRLENAGPDARLLAGVVAYRSALTGEAHCKVLFGVSRRPEDWISDRVSDEVDRIVRDPSFVNISFHGAEDLTAVAQEFFAKRFLAVP